MSYGGHPYGGVAYAGSDVAEIPQADTEPALAVEVSFTTDALETPVWVDITPDVREWDTLRGRNRELERFQPGRATVVLSNRERQYDSVNADGPWFGNLRPMRRMRIRETFNGVTYPTFDGFVDRWQLDYPDTGKDATATVTATDAFKMFARTDLPRSVYTSEVETDSPAIWWRLDEPAAWPDSALNAGSLGTAGDGTYVGPVKARGAESLVFLDPGASIQVQDPGGLVAVPDMGVQILDTAFDLSDYGSWAIEFWTKPAGEPIGTDRFVQGENASGAARLVVQSSGTAAWQFRLTNSGDTAEYGVTGNAADQVANQRYHIVAKFGPNKDMAIYVNGTKYTTVIGGTTAPPLVGVIHPDMDLGFFYTFGDSQTPEALGSEFAIYTAAEATDPLSDARVLAHYTAGTSPWQDDQPDDRLGRILDVAEWPDDLRAIDPGAIALQSASTDGQTVLEHAQKVAETEFGLLFMSRDGKVRLIDRAATLARAPGPEVFGDTAGEIGYREFVPNDGDDVIRNRAVISRLNGVAQTSEAADSISEFGRFDYVLDGLLHRSDSYSQDYADLIVAEYQFPRRRVTTLALGPAIVGEEADLYPQMLGRELGDSIEVRNRPLGGGDPFEQVCVIEGIRHSGTPGGARETAWTLSPELESNTAVDLLLTESSDPIETEAGLDLET